MMNREMRSTKVIPPAVAANVIPRPRLERLVERVASTPVTIVRAAGGFGKSTLLRAWSARLEPDCAVAWVSLDPQDASATMLIAALSASFARALPGFGTSTDTLQAAGIEQPLRLVAALTNELVAWTDERDSNVFIFIDDVQFVLEDAGAVSVIGELLRGLTDGVHVVLSSRSRLRFAPVGKLRASGSLLELDEDDLRFTPAEAAQLLPNEAVASEVVQQTEGWAIALGLSANVIAANSGAWQRVMQGSRESIFDFLAEEVLERLPADLRNAAFIFAVPSAIDEVYAGALLGEGTFGAAVAELVDYGLYVSAAGDNVWRFHQLFRDFLLERFRRSDPERLRNLQIRYAGLLRRDGLMMEALGQLLDAEDYEQIVDYVLQALTTIRVTDRYKNFIRLLSRVPDDIMARHPMLHRFYGTALLRDGRLEPAQEQFKQCYERSVARNDWATACAAQMEMGIASDRFYFIRHGDFARSEAHFRQGVALADRPELASRPVAKAALHWHLGMALACRSSYVEALEHLEIAEEIERRSERHVDNILVEISMVHGWMGNWPKALEYAEQAEELFRAGEGSFQTGRALMAQALAHLSMHPANPRGTEAAQAAVAALIVDQPDELPGALTLLAKAMLNHSPPSLEAARRALEEAASRIEANHNPVQSFDLSIVRAEAALLAGDERTAAEFIARAGAIASALNEPRQLAIVAFTNGLLAIVQDDDASAEHSFRDCIRGFEAVGDRFHHALALLSLLACRVRLKTVRAAEVETFFELVHANRLEYVCASAPRSSLAVLLWCLQTQTMVDRAEALFATLGGANAGLGELAQDSAVPSASRASAIRLLAKSDPSGARAVIKNLCLDSDPLVAGTARATLDYLPGPEVSRLRISVVGELRVRFGDLVVGEKDERFGRKRAVEMLRFLAVARGPVTKAAVINALWPESDSVSDTTLRVTLHLLRRALQPDVDGAGDYVYYDGASMRLDPDVFDTTDAQEADAALRRADLLFARRDLSAARTSFNLAIATFSNCPREEDAADWLKPHIRHWRGQCIRALHGLSALEKEHGDREAAMRIAQHALTFDPLHEESVCALLDLHADAGEHDAARSVFAAYKRRLTEVLDVTPGPAVLQRYTRIVQQRPTGSQTPLSAREREVLALVARGLSNKQIGAELELSTWTINNHVAKILKKLNVESRTAAAALAADS